MKLKKLSLICTFLTNFFSIRCFSLFFNKFLTIRPTFGLNFQRWWDFAMSFIYLLMWVEMCAVGVSVSVFWRVFGLWWEGNLVSPIFVSLTCIMNV